MSEKVFGLSVGVLGLVATIVFGIVGVLIWAIDKELEEERATPKLSWTGQQTLEKGTTQLGFTNDSENTANISKLWFFITDRALLQQIEAKHPRGMAGDVNNVDHVFFTNGYWHGQYYAFTATPNIHVNPNLVQDDIKLHLVNPLWDNYRFSGELVIQYNGKEDYRLKNVTLIGTSRL